MLHGPGCTCALCVSAQAKFGLGPLANSRMTIDKAHEPFGKHVDIVTPLGSDIPGTQKLRIGRKGNILNEEFNLKGGFTL